MSLKIKLFDESAVKKKIIANQNKVLNVNDLHI